MYYIEKQDNNEFAVEPDRSDFIFTLTFDDTWEDDISEEVAGEISMMIMSHKERALTPYATLTTIGWSEDEKYRYEAGGLSDSEFFENDNEPYDEEAEAHGYWVTMVPYSVRRVEVQDTIKERILKKYHQCDKELDLFQNILMFSLMEKKIYTKEEILSETCCDNEGCILTDDFYDDYVALVKEVMSD